MIKVDRYKYCDRMKLTQKVLIIKGGLIMAEERVPLFVGVDTVKFDLGVSRAKAYEVIKELNREMKAQNPRAIVVTGKVNRIWYEEACLRTGEH